MKNWYRIQAKGPTSAEVLIYDEIGMFGISAKTFIADLKALGSVNEITLGINSPGGDVFDGIAIYNALKRHPARITGRVDGIAASIASVILMAADHVVMPDNSMLMIHNPWGGVLGDAEDMREFADALDKIKIAILAAYRRSGKTDEELSAIMNAESWFTAEEAKTAGFADEVIESVDIAAFFDLGKYQKAPAALKNKPARQPAGEDRAREIAKACADAGVPAAVTVYLNSPWTSAEVAARLAHAPAVRALCKEYGAEELADHYVSVGFHPDDVKAQLDKFHKVHPDSESAEYTSKVLSLCTAVGVADLAPAFIEKKMSIEDVAARLAEAPKIRAICRASGLPTWEKRAGDYIRAGVNLEEARGHLFNLCLALQGPEIDNKLGPDFERSAGNNDAKINANKIYARRKNAAGGGAEELGQKLAKVIQEHGQLR